MIESGGPLWLVEVQRGAMGQWDEWLAWPDEQTAREWAQALEEELGVPTRVSHRKPRERP